MTKESEKSSLVQASDDEIVLPHRTAVNRAISDSLKAERERARAERQPGARQWVRLARDAEKNKPGDLFGQFAYCIRNGKIPAGTGRKRNVGDATERKFGSDIKRAFNDVRAEGAAISNLSQFGRKHVFRLLKRYLREGKSPSTVNARVTALRRLLVLLGRTAEIPTGGAWKRMLRANDIDPEFLKRSQVRVIPKSVTSKGLRPQDVIDKVAPQYYLQRLWLRLQWHFGLRPRECAELRPCECDLDNHLLILSGAKADRKRPIRLSSNPERRAAQRALLEEAKQIAGGLKGVLREREHTVQKALNRFYYVMKKSGITGSALNVIPYSFRHEFAHDEFEETAGVPAPVLRKVNPSEYEERAEAVQTAQNHVVLQLGHSAVDKGGNYLGTVHEERRRVKRQKTSADMFGLNQALAMAIEQAAIQDAWLLGKAASGDRLMPGEAVELALRAPKAIGIGATMKVLAALQAFPRPVTLVWCSERPDGALEVVFQHQRLPRT